MDFNDGGTSSYGMAAQPVQIATTTRARRPAAATQECAACPVRARCLPSGMGEWESRCLCAIMIGRRRLRKGQHLYREGDRFSFMYAVRFGSFKSTTALRDGSEQVTAFHLPGEMMGFDGTATGIHPTSATALEDAEICAVPYTQLSEASAELRSLRQLLMRLVATELVRDQRLLTLIANAHAEERVAAFLLHVSQRMEERGYSPSDFLLRMTRADIGSYLGTTLETVSRCLSAFSRRGYITVAKRRIQIVSIDKLREEYQTRLP